MKPVTKYTLFLCMLLCALFPGLLFGFSTLFHRDAGALIYPNLVFLRESVLKGEFPLWNPYSHCGVPFLAQLGTMYPGNLVFIVLPMPWAFNFSTLAHLLLGGVGTYFLSKKWQLSEVGSQVAGAAYVFSSMSLSCMQWNNYTASLGWLPWVILCAVEAWHAGGKYIYITAIVAALQVLTATPELTGLTWLFLVSIFAFSFTWEKARRLSAVVLMVAGLVAFQVLPFLDLMHFGQRSSQYDTGTWAMPLTGWLNFILPAFHYYSSSQNLLFQTGQEFMRSYYLGFITLGLALVGLTYKSTKWRLVCLFSVLCLTLALGNNGCLYAWVKGVCPILGFARFPVKFVLLVGITMPLLAGFGVTQVEKNQDKIRLIITYLVMLLIALLLAAVNQSYIPGFKDLILLTSLVLAVAAWLVIPRFYPVLLVAIVIDGSAMIPDINPVLPCAALQGNIWDIYHKQVPAITDGRIISSPAALRQFNTYQAPNLEADFLSRRAGEWYNLNLLDRIPKVDGAVVIRPKWFDEVEQQLYYKTNTRIGIGLLDFLSTIYVSDNLSPTLWTPRPTARPLITGGQQAKLVPADDILSFISSASYEPSKTVFLDAQTTGVTATNETSTCKILDPDVTLNRISFTTITTNNTMVTISETYYHWWHASIDGKPLPLYKANHAFQALQIPPGKHKVLIVYQDRLMLAGFIISALTALIVVVGWKASLKYKNNLWT